MSRNTFFLGVALCLLAMGTGQALAIGRSGDADVVLVHAPEAEREFVRAGHGRHRVTFMRNDFVIAGPTTDPAGLRTIESDDPSLTALAAIASSGSRFLSRGDDSGTHKKELALWEAAGLTPATSWYQESGQGMGSTLVIASERRAYVLTDRATLTVLGDAVDLEILAVGGSRLENLYSEALARLMVGHEAGGEYDGALAAALKLADHDPLREDAHCVAMHAYYRLGQRSAALKQYGRCQAILEEELGAAPERLFASFESEPLAAASTAQVHQATLFSGEQVVVKVQRPGIPTQMKADLGGVYYTSYEDALEFFGVGQDPKLKDVVDGLNAINVDLDLMDQALDEFITYCRILRHGPYDLRRSLA